MSDETTAAPNSPEIAANEKPAAAIAVAVSETTVRAPAVVLQDIDHEAYRALQEGTVFFDLAPRHITGFTGEKAADALNGLVSNDVLLLNVGQGLYAATLTPKGKMLADVSILRTEPHTYLVETSEAAGREWWSMIRKYVNPRLAKYVDQSAHYATIGVYGPNAPAIIARLGTGGLGDQTITDAMEEGLRAWPNWAHASFTLSGISVRLVRAPYLGTLPGFEILAPIASRGDVLKGLARVGAVSGSVSVWQLAQLERGFPVFGLDMDVTTIPQEANLDDWNAISYQKGCYTGQETVARIHFRGHVNKHLRGLVSESLLLPGATIYDATGKVVGDVRRSGMSPRFGAIAIAMIRRELAVGSDVHIGDVNAGEIAQITALPWSSETGFNNEKRGAS